MLLLLVKEFSRRRRIERIHRFEKNFSKDLVGERIAEKLDVRDGTRNDRLGERDSDGRTRLLHVALGEVVNPRVWGGDLNGGASTSAPDSRVDGASPGLRGGRRLLRRHLLTEIITIFFRESVCN